MCGIGGIFRRKAAPNPDPRAGPLLEALRHRGPNDSGIYGSRDGHATLVHTRLSILDPSPSGHQPMRRGSIALTFNGEIYNFARLRRELLQDEEIFETQTDTEVLLALFLRHGIGCLRFLRGMFAFALWDDCAQVGFLARDRFGVKPLYYGLSQNGDLLFASEVRALLATHSFPRKIDPAALGSYFVSGSVAEPRTLIAGISCLEAGQTLEWRVGHATFQRYYEIKFSPSSTEDDPIRTTREALLDSVRHHLVSDVPIGIPLSGGLDSGAIVSLAREFLPEPPATLTLAVENQSLCESPSARARATLFGSRHHELLLTTQLAMQWLPGFLNALDQPTIDGFNTYCLAKFASAHGLRVLLSGVGGDEVFGGYPSFHMVPGLRRWSQALGPMRQTVAASARAWNGREKGNRIAHYLLGQPTLSRAYETVRSIFCPMEADILVERITGTDFDSDCIAEAASPDLPQDPREEVSHLELTRYLRHQLLRDADVMGMAHGVEIRVPFVDHVLFEKLQKIPVRTRLARGKQLLRQAVPEVAPLDRRKRGFTLPLASWLGGTNDKLTRLPPRFGKIVSLENPIRQWSLLVLLHWLERHLAWTEA